MESARMDPTSSLAPTMEATVATRMPTAIALTAFATRPEMLNVVTKSFPNAYISTTKVRNIQLSNME